MRGPFWFDSPAGRIISLRQPRLLQLVGVRPGNPRSVRLVGRRAGAGARAHHGRGAGPAGAPARLFRPGSQPDRGGGDRQPVLAGSPGEFPGRAAADRAGAVSEGLPNPPAPSLKGSVPKRLAEPLRCPKGHRYTMGSPSGYPGSVLRAEGPSQAVAAVFRPPLNRHTNDRDRNQ